MRHLSFIALVSLLEGCALSHHPTTASKLGIARRTADLEAVIDVPGPVTVETVRSADWAVERTGLLNFDNPAVKAAGLEPGNEPIEVDFHVLRHPTFGVFIIDSGVETAWRHHPEDAAIRGLVASVLQWQTLKVVQSLGEYLAATQVKLEGVFITHLHPDHVSGVPDVPKGTPLYVGPGETEAAAFQNVVLRPNIDRALEGHTALNEWPFGPDGDARFAGVVDVFGDGSVWALWVPGHTPGSVAFVVRTLDGPVLLTGDTSHTAWGWLHDVEPGGFSDDRQGNAVSLAKLRRLFREHPKMSVRLGHQRLP